MKVFFNTLFHGDKKTKILLWGCVIAGIAMVACLVMFIITMKMPWIFGTIFCFLIPLIILRKYDFSDNSGDSGISDNPIKNPEPVGPAVISGKTPSNTNPANKRPGLSTELLRDAEEAVKTLPVKKIDPLKAPDIIKPETVKEEKPEKVKKEKPEKVKKEKAEKVKKEKPEKVKKEKAEKVKKEKPEKVKKPEKPEPVKEEKPEKPVKAEPALLDVDQKEMKQIMVKYKVKREHKPIIVDSSDKYKISHCPAYIWVYRKKLHLLLLEQTPRELSFDISRCSKMTFSKVIGNPATEYADIRTNRLLSSIFSACIPIYHEDFVDHRRASFKNLYTLVDDIKLTNTSARAAFDLTKAAFELPDRYNLPSTSGQYTREANKTKILWQDGVIVTSEFKTRIKNLLEDMTAADISDREFDMNLHEMVSRQLITKEYADYYGNAR